MDSDSWFATIAERINAQWQWLNEFVATPYFYMQLAAVLAALSAAYVLASLIKNRIRVFNRAPADGPLLQLRSVLYNSRALILPLLTIIALGAAAEIMMLGADPQLADEHKLRTLLIVGSRGFAVVWFFYALISRLVQNRLAKKLLGWIGIPVTTLWLFGLLGPLHDYLNDISLITLGNIDLSLGEILRTLIFGVLLFWLGALSNTAGKNVIRTREHWNVSTRELAAKLFEIGIFFVIFLLLLQIMGINLTALAVFGGALGIGLGFGLQQIASNFISGIIILLDRSITPGDYIELEDGRSGLLRELNMRFGILETFDGKDVMVPNEQFITTSYTNWTHKDKRQRYPLNFQVAYSTDLDLLFEKVREICRAHPKVMSGADLPIEFQPDAEIAGFGESGIDILCEFWMNGIDDGENRVGADLMHSIWRMIQEEGMSIPFPQREVRILGGAIRLEKDQDPR